MDGSNKDKEIVWLPAQLAARVKQAQSEGERERLVIAYLDESRDEVRANLETLDADLLQYRAMMAKAKEAFREAKEEQLRASYELWEQFEAQLPSTREKVARLCSVLEPIRQEVDAINAGLRKINTFQLQQVVELLGRIEHASPRLLQAIGVFLDHGDDCNDGPQPGKDVMR